MALKPETVPKPPNYYTPPAFADVQGVPTSYRRKGSGEPVVFLHGAGATRMWLPFYDLCAQSVDFIAPDALPSPSDDAGRDCRARTAPAWQAIVQHRPTSCGAPRWLRCRWQSRSAG